MGDSIFRSMSTAHSAPGEVDQPLVANDTTTGDLTDVEVPYTDAQNFLENYFELGTQWKDHDATFAKDFEKIDSYLRLKIENGEIANSQKAVKDLIKDMEKVNSLSKESRSVVKLEVLANYTEFLAKNEKLKSNLRRYGKS